MHKERIIQGIEKVFEGYAQDEESIEALRARDSPLFHLFSNQFGWKYCLWMNGGIWINYGDIRGCQPSSPRYAAGDYFESLRSKHIPNLTLTKAKEMLNQDLGKKVEKLKRDYARHFNQECDRQAESKYVQHPEV